MSLNVSNFRLGIGVPVEMESVRVPFFDSFIQMERPNFIYIPMRNGPIDDLRNRIVARALQVGCSHLIMMDTDQIYPVNTITQLLSRKLPVVHGLVYRRYPPFDNLMYKGDINGYTNATGYNDGDLV